MGHKTLMEARTSTEGERRAGDLDLGQDTREEEEEEEATEVGDIEQEGTEGTGALMRGSAEGSSEDGETTGEMLYSSVS